MNPAKLRKARFEDAAAIAYVHVESWRTTYASLLPGPFLAGLDEPGRALLWQDWLGQDIRAFVAEEDGRVVGFSSGGALREPWGDYDAELYTLYLLEEAQGRGNGKALLQATARALLETGYRTMLVWVLEQNPALHFYEKAGALRLTSRSIEVGGTALQEVALGWPALAAL